MCVCLRVWCACLVVGYLFYQTSGLGLAVGLVARKGLVCWVWFIPNFFIVCVCVCVCAWVGVRDAGPETSTR
jgi:hypothetical protein